MGRHSSDSEDTSRSRRKRRQRQRSSSSSSESRVTSRSKHSKRRTRSRSRDRNRTTDRRHRNRSHSSSSRGSGHRRRSRSADRGRSHRSHRSRSRSRNRRSRSRHRRSRSCSSGRSSRKRSRERDRGQRRTRDKDRTRDRTKDKDTDKAKEKDKQRETGNIKAGSEHLTSAEQTKARLQVLQTAAKTDDAQKTKENVKVGGAIKEEEEVSLAEQVRRIKDIEAIESDSFVPQAFKSSRDASKVTECPEIKTEAETVKVEVSVLPTSITYNDSDTLAHPNLFVDKEEAERLWLNRLISLRQERLMGSPVS
ncbi:serine/Arginine-related protein 53 [Danio rerio]|uniref:Serine/Arginine-related protein 53 n=1 Tax=Danio rerio TaxID=7955 RepID=A0AB32T9U9_DANRE|nr:serine/Arginine-related protein 53 [Danio rerio]